MIKTPALDAWRRELAAGQRTKYDFDPLWRAACRESDALDLQSIPRLAEVGLRDARRIIRNAITATQAAS